MLTEKIAQEIKKIRKQKNLTQTELSITAFNKTTNQRITQIENVSRGGITLSTLEKVLNALDHDIVLVPKSRVQEIEQLINEAN